MGKIKLKEIDTRASKQFNKEETKKETEEILEKLNELQNLLFAESKNSLLVIIQGMDASGKDGVIRNVFGTLNPQGVEVKSFSLYFHCFRGSFIRSFNRSICSSCETCK